MENKKLPFGTYAARSFDVKCEQLFLSAHRFRDLHASGDGFGIAALLVCLTDSLLVRLQVLPTPDVSADCPSLYLTLAEHWQAVI